MLTVVAIALSATLFTALLTIAGTARTRVLDQLAKGGALAGIQVDAAAPDPTQADIDNARGGGARDLNAAAIRRIAALDGVAVVSPIYTARVLIAPPNPTRLNDGRTVKLSKRRSDPVAGAALDTVVGVDLTHVQQLPITMIVGRLPAPGSVQEVDVTPSFLARFGIERADAALAVGLQLRIGVPRQMGDGQHAVRWTHVSVVGVAAHGAGTGGLLASFEGVRDAGAWQADGPSEKPLSQFGGAFVVARGMGRVAEVREQIASIGYSTRAPENLIDTAQRYLHVVEIVLVGIGLIAVAIAALGVSNALVGAVRERRREIGVLKAIGARDRDVRRIFLLEAGFLGLLGGVVGTGAGVGVATLVSTVVNGYLRRQGLAGVRPDLPLVVVIASVVGSALLAVAAGAVPAQRAARLGAREAVDA